MTVPIPPRPTPPRRREDFHDLMRHRVMDILLVSSPYDSFVLEEAGELSERVLGEFRNLDLHYGPGITSVATGTEAIALAREQSRFNLIVTTLQLGDMNAAELARRAADAGLGIPVVALAFDNSELTDFLGRHDVSALDRVFLWQGDARILVAIVKDVEDRLNVAHDTGAAGVQVILVIEDNVRYYSSLLPTIYGELLHQSQQLTSEGVNLAQKILRMRARPKILLCRTFEEAWAAFTAYRDDILGVISDVEFPRGGERAADAGLEFARMVRGPCPDVPILLHSSRPENEERARDAGADFLLKGSPVLLQELRRFMVDYFGFGPFVFRTPEGREVGRALDLRGLEDKLRAVPVESVVYHAERNHFSKWLKARTEFRLAHRLRPRTVAEFAGPEGLRSHLIDAIAEYRRERGEAVVADFDRATFDGTGAFHRLGGGSLGGKARGLAFMRRLLAEGGAGRGLGDVRVTVPAAVVVATDVFDRFLDNNHLRDFALRAPDDALRRRFEAAPFPADIRRDLRAFVERVHHPLAVRSSSLLEDSPYQPFTGVYETLMLANDEGDRRRAAGPAGARHQARVRVHLHAAGEGLHPRDTLPPGGGEDGGHPPAGRGRQPRRALLSRPRGRGAVAQLLPVAAADRAGRHRRRRAGPRADGGGRGRLPPLLAAAPPALGAVLVRRRRARELAADVLGPRAGRGRRRRGRGAPVRSRRRGGGRDAGRPRLHLVQRERCRLRRRVAPRRASGHPRAGAQAPHLPARGDPGPRARPRGLGDGGAGGNRVRGHAVDAARRAAGVRPPAAPAPRACRGSGRS